MWCFHCQFFHSLLCCVSLLWTFSQPSMFCRMVADLTVDIPSTVYATLSWILWPGSIFFLWLAKGSWPYLIPAIWHLKYKWYLNRRDSSTTLWCVEDLTPLCLSTMIIIPNPVIELQQPRQVSHISQTVYHPLSSGHFQMGTLVHYVTTVKPYLASQSQTFMYLQHKAIKPHVKTRMVCPL